MLTSRTKHFWLVVNLLILILPLPLQSSADTQLNPSPALQTIFKQADATYFGPPIINATLNDALNQAPEVFAMTVGMTLQRQKLYVSSQSEYYPQYNKLLNEAESFMKQVAKAYHYKHPGDGSPLPEERMVAEFLNGLNGNMNQQFIQKFGIDPTQINLPLMLAQVLPPQKNSNYDESGKLQIKKEPENITLLEVETSSADDLSRIHPASPNTPSKSVTGPYISKIICPQHDSGVFVIDTDNNPNGWTEVQCTYNNDGMLSEQKPLVDRVIHGVKFQFMSGNSSAPYHLWGRTPYTNGRRNGVAEEYGYADGKYQVHGRKEFVDGVLIKEDDFSYYGGSVGYYKYSTTSYVNGKPKEVMIYNEEGSKVMHGTYNKNGNAVYDACWNRDGTRKKCN